MTYTLGIDVGSTYTKALILSDDFRIVGKAMAHTGFKLAEISRKLFDLSLSQAGLEDGAVAYVVATGGILRFGTMARVVREKLNAEVNVPEGEMVQYATALGAAILGHQRLRKLKESGTEVSRVEEPIPA